MTSNQGEHLFIILTPRYIGIKISWLEILGRLPNCEVFLNSMF